MTRRPVRRRTTPARLEARLAALAKVDDLSERLGRTEPPTDPSQRAGVETLARQLQRGAAENA